MIPNILHVFWGRNKKLSYLRYLTLTSFRRHNPDWEIRFHMSKNPQRVESWATGEQKQHEYLGDDYLKSVEDIHGLSFYEWDEKELDMQPEASEVLKSDVLRLYILSTVGGVWSDMDILYTKPLDIDHCFPGGLESYICRNGDSYAIGFLASESNSMFYRKMFLTSLFRSRKEVYQSAGNQAFEAVRFFIPDSVGRIDPVHVYPIDWDDTYKLFSPRYKDMDISAQTGIHWFGGSDYSAPMDNSLTKDNLDTQPECLMRTILEGLI